jgi:uncharacterized protein with NRDE domain
MCLLVLAWLSHPGYRLVVASNRDEFHDRPAAPLDWWSDAPGILAGRDLRAGGTWLGVSRAGRFGLLTNFRDAEPAAGGTTGAAAPSRGGLVPEFLAGDAPPASYLDGLRGRASQFAGFSLLVGDHGGLHYYSNVGDAPPRALPPGIYGLSNHSLDAPWPKLVRTRERFTAVLGSDEPSVARLFEVLGDAEPAAEAPSTGSGLPPELERALSAPFVRHERYGTRCSTVVLAGRDGRTVVFERRFDVAGGQTGATRIEFRDAAA